MSLTYREMRNEPSKMDREIRAKGYALITKRGKPLYEVRKAKPNENRNFDAELDRIFGNRTFTTKEVVDSVRRSRE